MKRRYVDVLVILVLTAAVAWALNSWIPFRGLANRVTGRQPDVRITYCLE